MLPNMFSIIEFTFLLKTVTDFVCYQTEYVITINYFLSCSCSFTKDSLHKINLSYFPLLVDLPSLLVYHLLLKTYMTSQIFCRQSCLFVFWRYLWLTGDLLTPSHHLVCKCLDFMERMKQKVIWSKWIITFVDFRSNQNYELVVTQFKIEKLLVCPKLQVVHSFKLF